MDAPLSARQLQEEAVARGYVDRVSGVILMPDALYLWLYGEGASAAEGDAAFGLQQGTIWRFGISRWYLPLTGQTGRRRPSDPVAPPLGVDPTYGSGIEGTQAAPAGDPGLHSPGEPDANPPPDPRADLDAWVERTRFKLPGDEIAFYWEAKRRGLTTAQVEEWRGAVPGSIDAEARARGLM